MHACIHDCSTVYLKLQNPNVKVKQGKDITVWPTINMIYAKNIFSKFVYPFNNMLITVTSKVSMP